LIGSIGQRIITPLPEETAMITTEEMTADANVTTIVALVVLVTPDQGARQDEKRRNAHLKKKSTLTSKRKT
jgi:hypothetical protein